jgi:hypothetical protein
MASGSIVERPPSSLPSGKKCLVPLSRLRKKKRTSENKNNSGEEDLCTMHGMSISACSVELWEQRNVQIKACLLC